MELNNIIQNSFEVLKSYVLNKYYNSNNFTKINTRSNCAQKHTQLQPCTGKSIYNALDNLKISINCTQLYIRQHLETMRPYLYTHNNNNLNSVLINDFNNTYSTIKNRVN